MTHKYLTAAEAAAVLGITVDELNRLREDAVIRGFSDRGNWKFREDHLKEYARTQETGSDPDIAIYDESGPGASDLFRAQPNDDPDQTNQSRLPNLADSTGSGDFDLGAGEFSKAVESPADDEDVDSTRKVERPSIEDDSTNKMKRPETESQEPSSDSTNKLRTEPSSTDDEAGFSLSESGAGIFGSGADDSGINLVPEDDGDSGVLLSDDSGVSDAAHGESGLMLEDNESAVLGGSDVTDGSGTLDFADDGSVESESESDITLGDDSGLDFAGTSGIALEADDEAADLDAGESGIALDVGESGIALDTGDSGIALDVGDSGIALETGESGIALDAGDSGIALETGDSGLALDFSDSDVDASTPEGTQRMQVDEDAANSEFTTFDDEESEADATQRVAVGGDSEFDLGAEAEEEDFAYEDDEFDDADDLIDEMDEVDGMEDDEDALIGSEDDLASSEFESGEFEDDDLLETPAARKPREPSWGATTCIGLVLGTAVMMASGLMTWQSMRAMWDGKPEPTALDPVVSGLQGIFE